MKVSQTGGNHVSGNDASVSSKRGAYAGAAQEAKKMDRSEKTDEPNKASTSQANLGVKAEISGKAREFSTAKAVASQTPDVREDRVADLKKRISEGSYRIDEDAIADRMVDEHLRGASHR